jgi:dienelactone hydrolase
MHRRMFVLGSACAMMPGVAAARARRGSPSTPISIERFDAPGSGPRPIVLLLHGSDGLTYPGRYATAARAIAAAGFTVFLPHYFESTGDRRAAYGELGSKFPAWLAANSAALDQIVAEPGVARNRIGAVGISLGGALALALSAQDPRLKAVVNYFGYLPGQLRAARRFPPTLILHGDADRIVPVSNAYAIETLLRARGGVVERQIYSGQGHGFGGAASSDAASRTASFLSRYIG